MHTIVEQRTTHIRVDRQLRQLLQRLTVGRVPPMRPGVNHGYLVRVP